jgi:hypothetical protein
MTGCLKDDHQYLALRRQVVVRWANSLSTEKTFITKEKEEIMGQMKTNNKRRKDLRFGSLGMYDHFTNQEAFALRLISPVNTR